MYQKLGQSCVTNWGSFVSLLIRANVVTSQGSFIITNQGSCCYKLGQLLQIRATTITKQGSYYKLGQNLLQIRAGIPNQGNCYKLGHNTWQPVLKHPLKFWENFYVLQALIIHDSCKIYALILFLHKDNAIFDPTQDGLFQSFKRHGERQLVYPIYQRKLYSLIINKCPLSSPSYYPC